MHRKVDELFKNAGFSNQTHSDKLSPLFPTVSHSADLGMGRQLDSLSQSSGGSAETAATMSTSTGGLSSSLTSAAGSLFGGGNVIEGLLGGGLLGDIFSGLTGLFGGGPSQPPPLVQYTAPQSQDFELATGGGQTGDAVYNQLGDPHVAPVTEPALGGLQYLGNTSGQSTEPDIPRSSSTGQSAPQITLNVQAMDSQSFLDRSQDIAQAVRQAMLNMHSINDVINDL